MSHTINLLCKSKSPSQLRTASVSDQLSSGYLDLKFGWSLTLAVRKKTANAILVP